MITLGDITNEIARIRNTIDKVEVRGNENRCLLSNAFDACNNLIDVINQTAQEIQNGSKSEEG